MGTNYYAKTSVHGVPIELHIGKSSGGWKFLFAEYDNLRSWSEWRAFLDRPGVEITDEYRSPMNYADLVQIVEADQKPPNWDYITAPSSAWGDKYRPIEERQKYERLDEHGYRFCRSNPEDWS